MLDDNKPNDLENQDDKQEESGSYFANDNSTKNQDKREEEKVDDSFFFENQEQEEEVEDYTQRESEGFAGFIQKIHSILRPAIEKAQNTRASVVILFIVFGILTFCTSLLQRAIHPEIEQKLATIPIGANPNLFYAVTAVVTMIFQYLICRIIFHFTKKEMKPIPNPNERDGRIAIYVVCSALIGLLFSALPSVVSTILGIVVGVILYAGVFYDRVQDERLIAIGVKSEIIALVAGLIFGLVTGIIVVAIIAATSMH